MRIELITIGDELLLGFTVDTNAAHIARELATLGVQVVRRATVGDDPAAIAGAVREALERTGGVITTGGLGPTSDDLTAAAIGQLFGRELVFHEDLWERLRELWRSRGRAGEPPAANRRQVTLPAGAIPLENRHGTAPGVWIEDDRGRWVAMLPGVPREMRGMLTEVLLPRLRERLGDVNGVVRSRTVRTTGLAESMLPELLGEYQDGFPELALAYIPGQEGVDLRLTARGLDARTADAALADGALKLRERVGRYVYGEDSDDLAAIVLELCRARELRIGIGESCTGGLLGARLTAIPGSSDVVVGGVIAYDNSIKLDVLGVDANVLRSDGAVSEAVAKQMASGARRVTGARVGIAITGVAGPTGGTPTKPVGTVWIAADIDGVVASYGGRFIGDRAEIRFRSTQAALDMVRRALES